MKIRPVVVAVALAAATAIGGWTTTVAAPSAHADIPAGDCAVLKQIAGSTISTLAPLQSAPPDQAAAAMSSYVAQLRSQESQVSSPEAQGDIEALASALENATGPESASAVYGALGTLNTACS